MRWKILDIKTWDPGYRIDQEECRKLFGDEVANMKGPNFRCFYNGENLLEVCMSVFDEWLKKYDIPKETVSDCALGTTYLPQEWFERKPDLPSAITNEMKLDNGEPSIILNRICTTIPSVIEYLDNKRVAGRRKIGDTALVAVLDFPSLILRRDVEHHAVAKNIFGDGCFFMLMRMVKEPTDLGAGYIVEDVDNLFVPYTGDKAYSDENGAIFLSRYMTDDVPNLVVNIGIKNMLDKHKLKVPDIRYWPVHPGGVPIIAGIEKLLGLEKRTLQYCFDTFFEGGNRYAVSAGYVFDRLHREYPKKSGDRIFMATVAIGIYLGAVLMTYYE